MALIPWDPKLATGDAAIDAQHRTLLATFNGLHAAMKEGQGRRALEPALKALDEHFRQHFALEEALMEKGAVATRAAHCLDHGRIWQQVQDLQGRLSLGQETMVLPMIAFLNDYLVDHIMTHDFQMAQALQAPSADPGARP